MTDLDAPDDPGDLYEARGDVHTDWVEAALDVAPGGDDDATINEAEKAFHAYFDEDDRRRRMRLQQPHLHSDLRRECRREVARRYAG